jgi:hypothetical protein
VAAIKPSDLAHAIDRMYEAAAYPELWPDALGSFANSLGGFGGSIVGFGADEKLISYVSPESAEVAAAYAAAVGRPQFQDSVGRSAHAAWPIFPPDRSGPAQGPTRTLDVALGVDLTWREAKA